MSRISKVAAVMAGTGALVAGGAGMAFADAGAGAVAAGSPGVLSGNVVQVPVHVPVNVCGNTVNVIALLNPAFGNTCANVSDHQEVEAEHHDDAKAEGDYGYGH
ncbi:chaplin [Streptomyces sp. NPDC057428]|uniref:chaplin n=1 Tax=Streptomyces sp. NPDC057428 TaxID=3346129 RepID=UPI00369524D6